MEKEAGEGSQKNEESASSHAQKGKGKARVPKLQIVRKKEGGAPRHESSPSSPPLSPAPLHEKPFVSENETPQAEEKRTELPVAPGRLPNFFQNRDLWSSEEDEKLKQYARDHNKNWKKISGLINGRSHHDCMMRFYTMTAPIGGMADGMDLEKIHRELAEIKLGMKTSVGRLEDQIEFARAETLTALTAINDTTTQILSKLGGVD